MPFPEDHAPPIPRARSPRAKHTAPSKPHPLPEAGDAGPQPMKLTGERARLWRDVRAKWSLESASENLLRTACEALERAAQLAAQTDRDGATYSDRFGQIRANPAVMLERDFRALATRTLAQLAARLEG